MPLLWIVDRSSLRQSAIARLAAAPESAVNGAPGDPGFDSAPAAEVVLLGLSGDFETELEFAHRALPRVPRAGWILLAEPHDRETARRLFDSLDASILGYPPDPDELRTAIQTAAPRREPAPVPLSQRSARDALAERFARWFADLELPEVLRTLDPQLGDVSLLIQGEPGTGRGLLARYVHVFASPPPPGGAFGTIPCLAEASPGELLASISALGSTGGARAGCTLWLDAPDELAPAVQRQLRGWIEFGLPAGILPGSHPRWVATVRDASALDRGLRLALGGLRVEIPPLRARTGAVVQFANQTCRAWCAARGAPPRRLGEDALAVLEEYPWPGNLRELEAVITETLSAGASDPVLASDLLRGGEAFAPLYAGEFGVLVEEAEPGVAPAPPAEAAAPPEALVDSEAQVSAEPPGAPLPAPPPVIAGDEALRRLVGAVAHEVRNPLSTIRTFAGLLPERWQDREFRSRFAELVDRGVVRIEEVVERLAELAALAPPEPEPVDVADCLEDLLEEHRETIRSRHLLVLKELDATRAFALGDPAQVRFAFAGIVAKALELVPARGDVYLASKHHASGLRGAPSLRVLVRFHGAPPALRVAGTSPVENSLDFVLAEAMVRAQGGALTVDTTDGNETVIVVDLPAPAG